MDASWETGLNRVPSVRSEASSEARRPKSAAHPCPKLLPTPACRRSLQNDEFWYPDSPHRRAYHDLSQLMSQPLHSRTGPSRSRLGTTASVKSNDAAPATPPAKPPLGETVGAAAAAALQSAVYAGYALVWGVDAATPEEDDSRMGPILEAEAEPPASSKQIWPMPWVPPDSLRMDGWTFRPHSAPCSTPQDSARRGALIPLRTCEKQPFAVIVQKTAPRAQCSPPFLAEGLYPLSFRKTPSEITSPFFFSCVARELAFEAAARKEAWMRQQGARILEGRLAALQAAGRLAAAGRRATSPCGAQGLGEAPWATTAHQVPFSS